MELMKEIKEIKDDGSQSGKHLIFQLDEKDYGIQILKINEIIKSMTITPIPKSPPYIKGVINLRGKIIPVMDLRLKFNMLEKEYTQSTCIIIVDVFIENLKKQIGVIVDIVSEVFDIPKSDIEPPPRYGSDVDDDFLNGVGKIKEKIVMLLNIEKIIYSDEVLHLLKEDRKEISV